MQHFLPVKNIAMFGKLLQPKTIFDSSCIKAYQLIRERPIRCPQPIALTRRACDSLVKVGNAT